ncbi:bifunctional imidazole glycerol-phosphate dehydratase/histidinol phosphatase [Elizabethkingia miricola]|jgi:imidazoleglycerol-phosphate dehydratase / histidinol-phosphatase|uniref:Histidine biosynthesis bifunctional protein HisB n=1 Tax=Elizabethkingia miricola TaxID=172045 RepID=A0ABD4DPH9_ELIMR|nr:MULTISPECIES: bifunctional histidinol-phosphatase/imidazoleglycerol-phosphate dehydratase HisB [Elizabethkingia]KUY20299.1 imidazoleglycerol-phosphate dehydratase [Elizabethkingia miricola]MCL1653521.1 bifunctional histidinol-phosphatase/imidazoleglycerol-phosphate dehydratase HisB [Elizabethkingia miricola]OPC70126.1 bifunctional imidazole glycerol-phosphate dehydratase/histidinol phosphatase [Elizabethkingia miricola]OPC74058.1 bifunctional imidazole glycerol-phosphate dehydratase/histidin
MKKVLFIDRDGTLVLEPEDYQIDSFTKLEFYPEVFQYLSKIAKELDYELVMVTNQDGLGTDVHPEENFWPVHQFIIKALENEDIYFSEVLIDKTFPSENAPTRKPNTGLLTHYINNPEYDLQNSYVIGDRITDVKLAKNLDSKGIFIANDENLGAEEISKEESLEQYIALKTTSWKTIYEFLKLESRIASIERNTNETKIKIKLNLDGTGKSNIQTGLGFFDHMLDQIARHGQMDLDIKVNGDLEVDEHHTIEDTAIALGEVFSTALGNKLGIERYGFTLPMDDCLAQVAIDFGGRNWLVWDADFKREKIGEMPTEMFYHFFKSFTDGARANLNIKAEGQNEHHKIEAIFKAFAKAIKSAVKRDPEKMILPSTKGML